MLSVESRDGVTLVRMEHGKVNALDVEFLDAIADRLEGLAATQDGAFVLTSRERVFSAGVDLRSVLASDSAYATRLVRALSRCFLTLYAFPRPVVAAVNGHAIAGGCILACACDFRIMARGTATIGIAELRVGVPFPTAALEIMRSAVAARSIQELFYLAENHEPEAALRHGLVDRIVDPDRLEEEAIIVARRLGEIVPGSFAATKSALRRDTLERITRHAPAVDPAVEAAWSSTEVRTAMERFMAAVAAERSSRG